MCRGLSMVMVDKRDGAFADAILSNFFDDQIANPREFASRRQFFYSGAAIVLKHVEIEICFQLTSVKSASVRRFWLSKKMC